MAGAIVLTVAAVMLAGFVWLEIEVLRSNRKTREAVDKMIRHDAEFLRKLRETIK